MQKYEKKVIETQETNCFEILERDISVSFYLKAYL